MQKSRIARIACSDENISNETVPPDPLDGRTPEPRTELSVIELQQRGDRRSAPSPGLNLISRAVSANCSTGRRQTIVAAVYAVPHRSAKLMRDRPLMLDCEIRNAAARVEAVRAGKRASGRHPDSGGKTRNEEPPARPVSARPL